MSILTAAFFRFQKIKFHTLLWLFYMENQLHKFHINFSRRSKKFPVTQYCLDNFLISIVKNWRTEFFTGGLNDFLGVLVSFISSRINVRTVWKNIIIIIIFCCCRDCWLVDSHKFLSYKKSVETMVYSHLDS